MSLLRTFIRCKKLFDANTKCSAFVDCVLRRAVEAHNSKKYSEFIQQQLLKAIGVEEVSSRNGNWILGRLWNELGINLGCGFKRFVGLNSIHCSISDTDKPLHPSQRPLDMFPVTPFFTSIVHAHSTAWKGARKPSRI